MFGSHSRGGAHHHSGHPHSRPPPPPPQRRPCRYHHTTDCIYGIACTFLHAKEIGHHSSRAQSRAHTPPAVSSAELSNDALFGGIAGGGSGVEAFAAATLTDASADGAGADTPSEPLPPGRPVL